MNHARPLQLDIFGGGDIAQALADSDRRDHRATFGQVAQCDPWQGERPRLEPTQFTLAQLNERLAAAGLEPLTERDLTP